MSSKSTVRIISIILLLTGFFGCAPRMMTKKEPEKPQAPKRIVGIVTEEDAESFSVRVQGNEVLTYTSVKQPSPLGVVLYFPGTVIGVPENIYPTNNDTMGTIRLSMVPAAVSTTRIEIELKRDVPYETDRDGSDLRISFKKGPRLQAAPTLKEAKPGSEKPPETVEDTGKTATVFKSIATEPLKDGVEISVKADGAIKDFHSFAIESPPRIVFDLFNLKSPVKKEQQIPVNTPWIQRIRYYAYPDRLRIVLETEKAHLSSYSARSTADGLIIRMQSGTVPEKKEPARAEAAEKKPDEPAVPGSERPAKAQQEKPAVEPAWVNRIDFSSEPEGRSSILIGTTQPVRYELRKITEKYLILQIFNTRLPDQSQRPLITTRFDSAVDRITPYHAAEQKDTAMISIELREPVPYLVEESDGVLKIRFESSGVPGRSLEAAKLPDWQKVLSQTADKPVRAEIPTRPFETEDERKAALYREKTKPEEEADLARQRITDVHTGEKKALDLYREETVKQYTGQKIALDFFETDIKNVFRILREISGQNFAVDKDVTGKVTLSFGKPVPWDQVLDLVLKMNKLGKIQEGDIIRIATLATLKAEEDETKEKLKAKQESKRQEDHITVFIPINYSSATELAKNHIAPILTDHPTDPNQDGKVSVDERLNTIIISDVPLVVKQAKEIIERLDAVTPQVLIEARVVEAASSFSRELGTRLNVNIGPIFTKEVGGGLIPEGKLDIGMAAANLPAQSAGEIGINFSKIAGTPLSLNALLQASESEGQIKIVSSPRVLTLDNKEAIIKQGTQVPIPKLDDAGNTVIDYRDVDLKLTVVPHVTPDKRISLKLDITKNDIGQIISGQQSFTTKQATTELLVNDGETIVIGGIRKTRKDSGESGVPGLKKVPVLGWLFKTETKSDDLEELLIFITPKIVMLEPRARP